MKQRTPTDTLPAWLQWGVLGGLTLIFLLLPFHAFLSTWGGIAIGPLELWKSWKEVFLIVIAAYLVFWLSMDVKRWRLLLKDSLAWWILGFIFVLVLQSIIHFSPDNPDTTFAGLASTGRYFLIFTIAYTLFRFGDWNRSDVPDWPKLRCWISGALLIIGIFVSLLGIIQVHVLPPDFLNQFGYDKDTSIAPFMLIDDNPEALRAFATLRGPNDYGAFLILPLLLSLIAARKNKVWLIGTAVIVVAIFESASRSAWIGALIAVACWAALTYGQAIIRLRKWRFGLAAGVIALVLVMIAALNIPSVRLEVFHSSPNDPSLTEGSTDQHWLATWSGLQRVAADPLGCGAGCAGPASYQGDNPRISENYYVQIAEEAGVTGLILWLGVAVMVARRLWNRRADYLGRALLATFIGLSAIAVWLHTWADDPLSLTWWLLAGAVLGYYSSVEYDKQELFVGKTHNPNEHNGKKKSEAKTKKEAARARR